MRMDLPSVLAARSSPVVPSVTGTSIQVASPQDCTPGLASPEPSGPLNYPGQHLHKGTWPATVRRIDHHLEEENVKGQDQARLEEI